MQAIPGQEAGQIKRAGHKRLFGVWLICVGCACGAVICMESVLRATPLGVPVFAALAAVWIALALGLWVRTNWAWWGAAVLNIVVVALWFVSRLVKPIDPHELLVPALIAFAVPLVELGYLVWRRPCFRVPREEKPRLRSPLFLATFGTLLVLGTCYALILNVDDRAREFPQLALEDRTVPPAENGYVVFREMAKEDNWFSRESDDEYELSDVPDKGTDEFRTWFAEAPRLLSEKQGYLNKVELMLSRPSFVFTEPLDPYGYPPHKAGRFRALARWLRAKSTVELAGGQSEDAMGTALDIVTMGSRYANAGGALIDYLVANAVLHIGIEQVRDVASSPDIHRKSLTAALDCLPGEDILRQAIVRTAGVEFYSHNELTRQLRSLEFLEDMGESKSRPFASWGAKLYRNRVPILKLNMTYNMVGDFFHELAFEKINTYVPSQDEAEGLRASVPEASLIDWVRNPVGLVLWALERGAYRGGLYDHYFVALAELRATRVLLALRAYYLDHGMLPETLEALAPEHLPEVPVDPFSGSAFMYEPGGRPPMLMSLGSDGKRDTEETTGPAERDIVVSLDFAAPSE